MEIPQLPGMTKIQEEKGENFSKATYLFPKQDISKIIKQQFKKKFQEWKLENEAFVDGASILEFSTREGGEMERVNLKIKFERGKGTLFSVDNFFEKEK